MWAPDGKSIMYNPGGDGDVIYELSLAGDTVWQRDIAATSDLLNFGMGMVLRAAPGGRTLYPSGLHKDGTLGIWALDDWSRGRQRLIVAFDDPYVDPNFISIGPDRPYLTVQRDGSDTWVADERR